MDTLWQVERRDRNGQTPLDVACSAHAGAGSATARTLSAQENISGVYRGRYRLTKRHERRECCASVPYEEAAGCQVQARFGEDVVTGDSVALLFFESRADFERAHDTQLRLAQEPPPAPTPGMPPAMARAGRVIESFEDPTRVLPHCLVVDGWEETLAQCVHATPPAVSSPRRLHLFRMVLSGLLPGLVAVRAS